MSGRTIVRALCGVVAAAALVLFTEPVVAQVSQEYLGTFVIPPAQQGDPLSCGRDNNDGAKKIGVKSVEAFEHQCDVTAFRLLKSDPRSADVRLSCTGEGNKWNTREIWNLQRVESRTMLVTTKLQLAETELDRKRLTRKMREDVRVTVYVKCPEQR